MTEGDVFEALASVLKGGGAVAVLAYAVRWLVGELKALADKRDEEHKATIIAITATCATERERCERDLAAVSARLVSLEDAKMTASDAKAMRALDVAESQATALKILANRIHTGATA